MKSSTRQVRTCFTATVLAFAATVAACSGDGSEPAAVSVEPAEVTAVAVTGDLFTDASDNDDVDIDAADVDAVVESIDPVPETGVPGIDSDDDFCRGWSRFAGSIQALTLAWIEQPPRAAATLEVAASDALVSAVEAMAEHLPTEIESNRQALTVDVPAPWLRRAARSREFLVAEGADGRVVEALGVVWIAALAEAGDDDERISIRIPLDADVALPAAATSFVAELPSVVNDPTLDTTAFDISPSLAYIADNCPDRATLAGNDDVG